MTALTIVLFGILVLVSSKPLLERLAYKRATWEASSLVISLITFAAGIMGGRYVLVLAAPSKILSTCGLAAWVAAVMMLLSEYGRPRLDDDIPAAGWFLIGGCRTIGFVGLASDLLKKHPLFWAFVGWESNSDSQKVVWDGMVTGKRTVWTLPLTITANPHPAIYGALTPERIKDIVRNFLSNLDTLANSCLNAVEIRESVLTSCSAPTGVALSIADASFTQNADSLLQLLQRHRAPRNRAFF